MARSKFVELKQKLRARGLALAADFEAGRQVWLCGGRSFPSLEAVERELKNGKLVNSVGDTNTIRADAGSTRHGLGSQAGSRAKNGDGTDPWSEILAMVAGKPLADPAGNGDHRRNYSTQFE